MINSVVRQVPNGKLNEVLLNCPICKVTSNSELLQIGGPNIVRDNYYTAECKSCHELVFFRFQKFRGIKDSRAGAVKIPDLSHGGELLHPKTKLGPEPLEQMPDDIKTIFNEAREVAQISSRSAAALLRLALQMICEQLEPKAKDINEALKNLVGKGLPEDLQQACDSIRDIGNSSVHSKTINANLENDAELVDFLFYMINIIVDRIIVFPLKAKNTYSKLPQNIRDKITKRDGKTITP